MRILLRNLYKVTVVFMISSLKKSMPIVIQSLSETRITGEWLKSEINKRAFDLVKARIYVFTNDHPSNVNVSSRLHNMFDED